MTVYNLWNLEITKMEKEKIFGDIKEKNAVLINSLAQQDQCALLLLERAIVGAFQ